jgi:phosphomannomutase/phosphoglucomutase
MFFADRYFGYDDAIYAAGRLLEILSLNECPLSRLVSKIPIYYNTPEIRISCPDDKKFEVVDNFRKMFSGEEVCTIDGVKVNFDKGWGLLRASNTEPALILRFEAIDKENLRLIKSIFEEKVSNILHVKTEF